MSTDLVETFRSSLLGTATLHETTPADARTVIEELIDEPAVGIPLDFEGVVLPECVETDLSPATLELAATGVTPARQAIANYGTVTLPSDDAGTELVSLYADEHVAVVGAESLVSDMTAAFERLETDLAPDAIADVRTQVLATGPSATADMGTLIQGVHGPRQVDIVLVEDR